MKIEFPGASDGVSGSRHLVETADPRPLANCGHAADTLRVAVQRELGWAVRVPQFGQSVATDGAP